MSVGAICFTSSGSNGGCWVVLVFPRLFLFFYFFLEKRVFFPIRELRQQKKFMRLTPKKKFSLKKNAIYVKKNKKATYAYFHNRATLSSFGRGAPGVSSRGT